MDFMQRRNKNKAFYGKTLIYGSFFNAIIDRKKREFGINDGNAANK